MLTKAQLNTKVKLQ